MVGGTKEKDPFLCDRIRESLGNKVRELEGKPRAHWETAFQRKKNSCGVVQPSESQMKLERVKSTIGQLR